MAREHRQVCGRETVKVHRKYNADQGTMPCESSKICSDHAWRGVLRGRTSSIASVEFSQGTSCETSLR